MLFPLIYAKLRDFLDIYENLIEKIFSCGNSHKFGQLLNKFFVSIAEKILRAYEKPVFYFRFLREDL